MDALHFRLNESTTVPSVGIQVCPKCIFRASRVDLSPPMVGITGLEDVVIFFSPPRVMWPVYGGAVKKAYRTTV